MLMSRQLQREGHHEETATRRRPRGESYKEMAIRNNYNEKAIRKSYNEKATRRKLQGEDHEEKATR